jgi:hypothetical protein
MCISMWKTVSVEGVNFSSKTTCSWATALEGIAYIKILIILIDIRTLPHSSAEEQQILFSKTLKNWNPAALKEVLIF